MEKSGMNYRLDTRRWRERIIAVRCDWESDGAPLLLHLAQWRPGRYELQRYDRNIADLAASMADGRPCPLHMKSSHCWELRPPGPGPILLSYLYFANQPDAGGSWLDETLVYVNPVNLLLYLPGRLDQPCSLSLDLPAGFRMAGALPGPGPRYEFPSFHELADTPFFASSQLTRFTSEVGSLRVFLHGIGDTQVFPRLVRDTAAFTEAALALFGDCPVDEYHYLYLLPERYFRHGVEHQRSTVIVMGPGEYVRSQAGYDSLAEIACHEFFHCWNVKALRPAELLPYDYDRPQYSALHYVTEGVTTYYGALLLWKAGVWNFARWIANLNEELELHYQMPGRDFVSLEESSLQSWVNGYGRNVGFPNRRISFYTKGCLVALLLDTRLRRLSSHRASLDLLMRELYARFRGGGYTAEAYQSLAEELAREPLEVFFDAWVRGTAPLEPGLEEVADFYGLRIEQAPLARPETAFWGLELDEGGSRIEGLWPGGLALASGLALGDELLAEGDLPASRPWLDELFKSAREAGADLVELQVRRLSSVRIFGLPLPALPRHAAPQFHPLESPSPEQEDNRRAWRAFKAEAHG
jgi:predicted metalloprotease with PDZ domain